MHLSLCLDPARPVTSVYGLSEQQAYGIINAISDGEHLIPRIVIRLEEEPTDQIGEYSDAYEVRR